MSSPLMRRTFSGNSAGAGPGSGSSTPDRARRARMLRDYYGLASPNPGAGGAGNAGNTSLDDPLTLDNPSFNADAHVERLLSSASLDKLVDEQIELMQTVRELDSEKQSLVYNHHHELISASDTIKQLQGRAVQLDQSLDKLKMSFERIQQLDAGLRFADLLPEDVVERGGRDERGQDEMATSWSRRKRQALAAIVTLPTSLAVAPKDQRATLWGQWEPVLARWEEEGVKGIKEVSQECRSILRNV